MKRYDIEYNFVSVRGDDSEYDYTPIVLSAVSEQTLNRLKSLFWVKILSVTPCQNKTNMI